MWSVHTIDQSELKLSSENKFVDGQRDGQCHYHRVPVFKVGTKFVTVNVK